MPITGVLPIKATYYKIINRLTGLYSCKGMWGWDSAGHIFTNIVAAKGHITRCINYYSGYYNTNSNNNAAKVDEYKQVALEHVDLIEVKIIETSSQGLKEIHAKKIQDKLDKLKRKAERVTAKTKKAQEKAFKKGTGPKPAPAKVTLRL